MNSLYLFRLDGVLLPDRKNLTGTFGIPEELRRELELTLKIAEERSREGDDK